ncbi:hypothetical protein [Shewanella polaris]|jgi:hypothetical protein|uniref:Uncharacterized protein n=1 Tax=Shewanella polaris TaxID=2588449 RepID=A0A4Y5YHP9_9GAMM|nr:hypothetical protein [Shewanella polaris]QDE32013.1 hypothetical protein FH971_14215 [Shewanella polaris]
MDKLKIAINNNHCLQIILLCWRVSLAIIGSYIVVSLFSAAIPTILATLFDIGKETVFLWMMLLSFLFYSLLVLWIISSRQLLKTFVQLTLVVLTLSIALQWSPPEQVNPDFTEEIQP